MLNFIIRGGEYNDVLKWVTIRQIIQSSKGEMGISVNRRFDEDKVSYLKYALQMGCDYAFHEKPAPFPIDIKSILNMDNNFIYRDLNVNGEYGVSVSEDNAYSFSRVRAILKTQELAPSVELLKVV